jgi:hypothetical protein
VYIPFGADGSRRGGLQTKPDRVIALSKPVDVVLARTMWRLGPQIPTLGYTRSVPPDLAALSVKADYVFSLLHLGVSRHTIHTYSLAGVFVGLS